MFEDKWSKYAVNLDGFDVMTFRKVFEESARMQATLDTEKLATAEELGQDVFDSLYKYVPQLRPTESMDAAYVFNRSLIEKAMGTQEYERLRSVTALQEGESSIATEIIAEELMNNLPEEDRQAVNDYAKKQQNLSKAVEQLKALSEMTKLTPQLQQLQQQLQQNLPKLQAAVGKALPAFNAACANPQVKAALRAALNSALQQIDMVAEFAGGWGLEPGQLHRVPAKERMDLMRRISGSRKIRELTKLLGRFKRLAFQKRYTRVTTEPSEVADVKLSNDIARVLPTELVYLSDKTTKILFFEKLVTRRLLTYEMRGRETYGRGPIIILVDNSGSMSMGAGGVTREMWAKAVGLAMAEIALKDRRTIELMNFGYRGEIHKIVIEPGLPPEERLRRLIDFAETNFGGGTDFEEPLGQAMADIDRQEFKKADIVMITDGECDFSDTFEKRFKELKEKKQFRLHSVIIGGTDVSLERISDQVHHLYDLLTEGDKVAGDLFEAV